MWVGLTALVVILLFAYFVLRLVIGLVKRLIGRSEAVVEKKDVERGNPSVSSARLATAVRGGRQAFGQQ